MDNATEPTTASAFRAALDEHLAALQARDADRFAATLGDDVVVIDGGGAITRGTDAVLRSHAEWFGSPDPWTFDYDVLLTRETASAGLSVIDVTYRHTPDAEPARFLLSLVFERDDQGTFKFVYDQNTTLR
ncbi:MAG TPA: nuclear transport factor 2 family protein [Candidatus Elarobacter sp.]|jgi:ketosteroid isomerase-like protein|nr:nuclear transport factor 2 family protein [Candidatus Elarobacter sp.]